MIGRRELIGAGLATGALSLTARGWGQGPNQVVRIAFRVANGRVLIPGKIGDTGPYLFILDTGGQLGIIDGALATKLGLKTAPGRPLTSVGGRHDQPWYLIDDLRLTAGRMPPMAFIGMSGGIGRGAGVSGSLGAALFVSSDTDIDFSANELRIYPKGRPDRDGWTRLKSAFLLGGKYPAHVAVDVEIDGRRVQLVADTGAQGNITLDGPASKSSGLWDDSRPYAPTSARGIGKALVRRRVVRAGKVGVGPFVFERQLISLSSPEDGENYRFTGMVGLGILSQLNLSTDVRTKTLWAQKNDRPSASAVSYSRSGLWLEERTGRVIVADVGTGSPAKAAGVAVGDMVAGMSLPQAIAAIGGESGSEVALKLERGGIARDVKFTLADYL